MSWFHSSLGHWMRDQEEIKSAIDNLWLLNKSLINICALRWIRDASIGTHLEESLSDSLVDDDQCVLGQDWLLWRIQTVFLLHNLFKLFKLMANNLSSHWVSYSISIDKDMIWQLSLIMVSECLEGALKVLLENSRANNLLSLLTLRTSLSVILAHMLIVCCAKSDNALFSFVTHINTNEHCLLWNLWSKVQAPEISSKLCVDLSKDVDVNSIVIFLDCLAWDKLWNYRTISVDLVFESSVQMLLFDGIRHNDQEKVEILCLSGFC